MKNDFGYFEGERCGRNGCEGIITEPEKEGGCSCHLGHAPCSYCTSSTAYCEICEWEAEDA